MSKKILSTILVIGMLFAFGAMPISASANFVVEYAYDTASDEVKEVITEEEYNALELWLKKSLWKYGIPNAEECENMGNSRAVTDSHFIPNFASFTFYTNASFSQTQNVCVPLAMTNCISYFDYLGRSRLVSGSSVSQSEFDQMCNLTGWSNIDGSTLKEGVNGLASYCRLRNYTATDFAHYLQHWGGVKGNLDSNYPVFVTQDVAGQTNGHINFAVGYKIEDGEKLLYVYTGESTAPIAWLNFDDVKLYDRIWIE